MTVHHGPRVPETSFAQFSEAVSGTFVPLHVTCRHPETFTGSVIGVTVDEVGLSRVAADEHTVERTPGLIARDDRSYFKLSLMLAGTGSLLQDGRTAHLATGDIAIYDTSRPYRLEFPDSFETLVVMFPKHLVDLPPELISQFTAVRLEAGQRVVSLVGPFLTQLATSLDELQGPTGVRLVHSALDLIGTMFARELDVDQVSLDPKRKLLQKVHAYIEANLDSRELSPASIAAAHFISTRHLHQLFSTQQMTVSSWIRELRLERCRRDLGDPLLSDRPVAAIAARWGFIDAAHFSRAFRARYNMAPSEARAARVA